MARKVVKKKTKLIKLRLFTVLFSIMYIISLFMGVKAFAETNPFKLNDASIEEKSENVTGSITGFDNDKVNNDITFHKLNDYVTYKLVIKSNIDKDITILSIIDDNENEYIAYEYDKLENKKVSANSTFDFLVKAIYKSEVTDTSKRNQTTNVKFTITYLEDGEVKGDTITINPKTCDGISKSLILLIISSVGLVTCIALDKKRKIKKLSKVSALIITGLVLTPIAVKAATYSYNITFKTTVGLYDKMIITCVVDDNEKTLVSKYGMAISDLEIPTKEGYTFSKWTYEDGSDFDLTEVITEDIKIIANFSKDTYTISYNLTGGTITGVNPTEYSISDDITLIEPEKEYYDFIGWIGTDITTPTKNVVIKNKTGNRTYTANYEPTDYNISYTGLTEEEKTSLNNPTSYNIETTTFTLNNPENRTDNDGDVTEIFTGWKENTTTSTTITLPNTNSIGNKTYEAAWTPASDTIYTINYELHDGITETENPISFTKNTNTFTLNNPSKEGYIFKGWSGTDLVGDENVEVNVEKGTRKNLSFEANYIANNYQVKFEKNGTNVAGTMSNQEFTYGIDANLNEVAYTRVGYTFTGWNTKADKSGKHYDNQEAINNLTSIKDEIISLYAEWEANQYEVTIVTNNANTSKSNLSINIGSSVTFTLTPNSGYYLKSYSCTNGYTINTLSTGTSATFAQNVKVNNNNVDNNSTCTFELSNKYLLYDVASVGEYVEYKPNVTSFTHDSTYGVFGTINPSSITSWRILSKNSDGTIDLIPAAIAGTLNYGVSGYGADNITYPKYEEGLQNLANSFINSSYATSARPVSETDLTTIKNKNLTITDYYAINKQDYTTQSWTGNQEGGANWYYYIYYAYVGTMEKFKVWDKYAGTGGQSSSGYSMELGVRPIVRLKIGIYKNGGSGTSSNPWKITNNN